MRIIINDVPDKRDISIFWSKKKFYPLINKIILYKFFSIYLHTVRSNYLNILKSNISVRNFTPLLMLLNATFYVISVLRTYYPHHVFSRFCNDGNHLRWRILTQIISGPIGTSFGE